MNSQTPPNPERFLPVDICSHCDHFLQWELFAWRCHVLGRFEHSAAGISPGLAHDPSHKQTMHPRAGCQQHQALQEHQRIAPNAQLGTESCLCSSMRPLLPASRAKTLQLPCLWGPRVSAPRFTALTKESKGDNFCLLLHSQSEQCIMNGLLRPLNTQ